MTVLKEQIWLQMFSLNVINTCCFRSSILINPQCIFNFLITKGDNLVSFIINISAKICCSQSRELCFYLRLLMCLVDDNPSPYLTPSFMSFTVCPLPYGLGDEEHMNIVACFRRD